MAIFFCNCGDKFFKKWELKTHIGLLNIHWPKSDPSDEHWEIDKAEYLNRQYRILKEGSNDGTSHS